MVLWSYIYYIYIHMLFFLTKLFYCTLHSGAALVSGLGERGAKSWYIHNNIIP